MGRWTVTAAQVSSAPSRAGPSAPQASPLGLRRSAGSGSRAPVSALLLALFAAALLALSFATPASAAAVTLGLSTGVEASAASLAEYQAQAEGYERGYRDDDEDGYHPSSASSRGRGGRNDDHSAAHAYYYNKGARSDQDHRSASSSHRSSSASSRNRNEHYANYAANHAPAPAHDSASLPQRPASPFADHEPAPAPAPAAPAAPQQLRRRSAFADVPVSAIETMQAATSESHRHVPPAPHVRLHQPEHFRTLSVKLIDSPLVDVKWSVKRSKAGHFTQHVVFGLSAQGVVYRSVDGGHVWESQAERFKHAKVLSVHVSKADSSYIAFRCAHGVHFFTADAGTTYQTPAEITYLHNHPLTDSNSPFFGGAAVDPLSFLSDVVTGINDALRPEGADPRDDEIMPEHVAEVVQTMRVAEFKHHPSRAGWILASVHSRGCFKGSIKNPTAQETAEEQKFGEEDSKTLCYLRLLVSLDNGRVWKQIISHAVQFDWGAPADTPRGHRDEKLIYVCGYLANDVQPVTTSWDPNIHFMESRDFFEDADLLVVHGNRFFTGHGYLFVAADDVTTSLENDVALFIRPPGGKAFQRAHIPISGLDQFSYTILDTAEGQVFLHVNHAPLSHRASSGHLYVSDAEGTMFSLSLMNIQRSQEGHCAFARVEAVEGVFLSNFLADAEGAESSFLDEGNPMGVSDSDAASLFSRRSGARSALQPRALTAITYNKGASWFHLVPPERDSQNRAIACEPDSEGRPCQLHLHGLAQDEHGPFYSDDRAPGMILATGSVGHYVHQHQGGVNTYVSRDAGFTWHEVFKGSHVYEFGDHGGLIVMADDTKPTQFLYFSWDEGATWEGVQITSLPFIVENIVVEPDQVNVQFVVYGYIPETANQHLADGVTSSGPRTTSASDAGVIAFVDFADLHKRTCQGARSPGGANSDYEYWSPHDSRMDGACLLGKRMSFLRRKQFAQCFNPLDRVPMQIMERCPCTVHDYQCDYGYFRQVEGGACVKDTLATYKSRDSIVTGASCKGTYLETKGYRRIPGDVCIGGAEWNPIVKPCPTRLGMGALLFFVVLLGAAVYALIHFHQKYDLIQLALDTYDRYYGRRAYVLVGGGNGPHGGDDDDDDLEAGVGPSKGSAPVPDYYDAAAVATGNLTSRKSMGGFHSVTATADDDESAEDTTSGAGVGVGSAIQSAAAMARGLGASVATKISAATGVSLGGMRATSEGGATYSAVAGGDGPAVDVATRLSPAASPIPPAAAASVPAPAPAPAAAAAASPAGSKGPVYFHERTDVDDLTDDDPLLAAAAVRSAARTPAKPPVATSVGTGAVQAPRVAPAAGAGELNAYASSAIPLPPRGGDDDAARTKAAFNLLD